MENIDNILEQYTLLRIREIEHVAGRLDYEHFEWIRFSDRRKSGHETLFDGTPEVFCPYNQKAKGLVEALNGEIMRLPAISECWGMGDSIMLKNDLFSDLELAPMLGIIATPATIMDLTKTKQEGYTSLSFHKKFDIDRVVERILPLPESERPLIPLRCGKTFKVILIHKNLLLKWQRKDIKELQYDMSDYPVSLKELTFNYDHYRIPKMISYGTIEKYQRGDGRF